MDKASEKAAELVDAGVPAWLDAAHANATHLLAQNKETVRRLAEELLARETLTGDEIKAIVTGHRSQKKTVKTTKKTKTAATKNVKSKK